MGKLTVMGVRALTKPGRHSDGDGLYLDIKPSGTRSWAFIYQLDGRRREFGLGSAKVATLAEARQEPQSRESWSGQGHTPSTPNGSHEES